MANNNSNFIDTAKEYGSKVLSSARKGALKLGRWTAGKLSVLSGKLSAVFGRVKGGSSFRTGAKRTAAKKSHGSKSYSARKTTAKGKTAFRRRPPVRRVDRTGINSHLTTEPQRYLRGIEAAELFELAEAERTVSLSSTQAAPERTGLGGFLYRHRKGLIAACMIFALLFGGVQYLIGLYNSDEVFITDEIQAGNITITDRLTTTEEQAEKVTYFLLLGVDDSSLLTDCIWIMCWDHVANAVNVMQVPRDTYVGSDSPGTGKINGVYANPRKVKWCDTCGISPDEAERQSGRHTVCGTDLVSRRESNVSAIIRVINDRLGLPIDHFVIFNFRGFAKIIDTMGGVDIHLDYTVKDAAIHLEPGDHHLTGWPAVDFMRSRKGFANGDIGRVSNQRILIDALLQKALNMDLASMLDVVITCANAECFQTDLSLAEIKDMAVSARRLSVDNLTMVTMPGIDYWPEGGLSHYLCDEAATAEMINEYLLPYGLPDGSMATADSISFPRPSDPPRTTTTTERTTTTTTEYSGGEYTDPTTTTTTTGSGIDITTPPSESTTEPTEGTTAPTESTTEPTEGTTAPTEGTTTTTTTTEFYVEVTTPPTETPTTTTTTTTAAPIITTTTAAPEGEPVGASVTTPLSDPRG